MDLYDILGLVGMLLCIVGLTVSIIACISLLQKKNKDTCDFLLLYLICTDMALSGAAVILNIVLMMLDSKDASSVRVMVILAGIAGYFALLAGWITLNIIVLRAWVIFTNKPSYYLPYNATHITLGLVGLLFVGALVGVSVVLFDPANTKPLTTSYMSMVLVVSGLIFIAMVVTIIQLVRKDAVFSGFDGKEACLACSFGAIYIITSVPMIAWFFLSDKPLLLGPAMFLLVVSFSSTLNPIFFMFKDSAMQLYIRSYGGGGSSSENRWPGYCVPQSGWEHCEC